MTKPSLITYHGVASIQGSYYSEFASCRKYAFQTHMVFYSENVTSIIYC